MTLTLITIPDSTDDWPQWLDRQLVGLELRNLVEELQLTSDTGSSGATHLLDIVTAGQRDAILQTGTYVLTAEQLRCLFGHPHVLLELQELVLERGGSHWDAVIRQESIHNQSNHVFDSLSLKDPSKRQQVSDTKQSPQSRQWMWIVSTVAVLLIAVTIFQRNSSQQTPWGLSDPALVSSDAGSAREWFNAVAEAGSEWRERDLSDEEKLLSSISDVSAACQVLIDNPHKVLTSPERQWFVQKCQNWKTKLDDTAVALQSQWLSFDDARTQANAIMTKLVDVLNAGPSADDLQALAA